MNKQSFQTEKKRSKRQERREVRLRREQELQRRNKRKRLFLWGGLLLIVLIGGIIISYIVIHQSYAASQGTTAATNHSPTPAAFAPVDGISCDGLEHSDYHIHIHLSLYINGQQVAVPQNIGINPDPNSSCLYWLHTHDTSGIIHIEAPAHHSYVLGNFFDIWSQHFPNLNYPAQLDQKDGWQVYVNGKLYNGDFRQVPITAHTLITLAYNTPGVKPDTVYNWGTL